MSLPQQTIEVVKHSGDGGAIAVAIATFLSWLPDVAALLSVIWLSLRIYECIQNIRNKKTPKP